MKINTFAFYYTKSVYGVIRRYPQGHFATRLCEILGIKTLTPQFDEIVELFGVEMHKIMSPE